MGKNVWIGIGILVVVVVGFLFFSGSTGNVVRAEMIDGGDIMKIPLSGIGGNAEFYDFQGTEFFVVRASDGSVKSAFNACDVCYRSKKGYRQEGGDMICNNCGNHYAIDGIGTKNLKGGGCWPGYLPSTVEGDFLVIRKSDLAAGSYRF
jgi:hypothetical protein